MKNKNLKFLIFILSLFFLIYVFSNRIKVKLNEYIIKNSSKEILKANEINPFVFKEINENQLENIIKKYNINIIESEINKFIQDNHTKTSSKNNSYLITDQTNKKYNNTNENRIEKNNIETVNKIEKNINNNDKNIIKKIDINKASQKELESIPGIGPVLSKRIIEYRKNHGNFNSFSDIMKVKGIGPKKLEKIKPYIKIK